MGEYKRLEGFMDAKRITNGWMVAMAAAACLLAAGCQSVPDAEKMGEIRAEAAEARVAAMEEGRTVEERGERLQGELSLEEAVGRGMKFNLALQRETLEREVAAGRIEASMQKALPGVVASGGYTSQTISMNPTDPWEPCCY